MGFRFRLHRKDLPGTPDVVLPRYRTVIFVHGCFWHRHPGCKKASMPQTNREFWEKKLARNVERDAEVIRELTRTGWRVLVVWECELKNHEALSARLLHVSQVGGVRQGASREGTNGDLDLVQIDPRAFEQAPMNERGHRVL